MQTQNPIFDQLARLMTEAAGAANGVREEFDVLAKRQIERIAGDMQLATREELEVIKDIALAVRAENLRLKEKIEELEQRLDALSSAESSRDSATD